MKRSDMPAVEQARSGGDGPARVPNAGVGLNSGGRVPGWIALVGLAVLLAVLGGTAAVRFVQKSPVGDFQHYYFAGEAVRQGTSIYDAGIQWYGYLPMFAVLMAPLTLLPIGIAGAVWAGINSLLIAVILYFGGRTMCERLSIKLEPGGAAGGFGGGAFSWMMLLAAGVMADKIRSELRLGQTDAAIMTGLVVALASVGKRPMLCGLALGFVGNFKYQSLGFIVYLLVRRRWAEAFWSVVFSAGIMLAGSLVWGWETNTKYLASATGSLAELMGSKEQVPGPFLFPIDWHRSVSIPSSAARAAMHYTWASPTFACVVLAAAVLVVGLGWWMLNRFGVGLLWGRGGRDDAWVVTRGVVGLEWSGLVVGTLVFAPQATSRHFFAMILPVLAASALLLGAARGTRRWPLAVGMLIFLLGSVLPPGGQDQTYVTMWRAIGGMSWCSLVFYFTLLWVGLDHLMRVEASTVRLARV